MYTVSDICDILSLYFTQSVARSEMLWFKGYLHEAQKEVREAYYTLLAASIIYKGVFELC